ncbi:nucleobase:cation symporter-2 family protein [Variovorax dokdonensis]|uniref:Nucleobase:cation symporter-2 family protein n=1 Tax=Variovorax dokdonensis TaxID=344883 RepID=A0ABT7NE19_9BURK|nr:nucleobase:cation symporter-2 family protein [Variovorax dokdonensis]MDM0046182.1 nucleobase:cation symporter-2 family protein [Variovorax dokdonensis]
MQADRLTPATPVRSGSTSRAHSVNERLPTGKLTVLGLQHVLVMYAGAVAVPLIIGRALNLTPEHVALLISADLFCCGVVSIIQSMGVTQWFGLRLPTMMGVSFVSVGPMLGIAHAYPGHTGAQLLFGSIIGAGIIAMFLVPVISRLLRFFPPVVTGTIILVVGINLMRIGINWIFGNPFGPTAPKLVNPEHAKWLQDVSALAQAGGHGVPAPPKGLSLGASVPNPSYASLGGIGISALVMVSILLFAKFAKGFLGNIAVLLGLIIGGAVATAFGMMNFDRVAKAPMFDVVLPFAFGTPIFDPVLILTFTLVMIVIMVESVGLFYALGEICDTPVDRRTMANGLRTDALGTIIGGVFNTFPYTSFSQNIGLIAVTGIRSRFVCVMGGAILIVLSFLPKMAAAVESVPTFVLGGAGLVMFGMVVATGVRMLSTVDFRGSRNNLFIVAIAVGMGMIPLIAPNFHQWTPKSMHLLIDSGILLSAVTALALNLYFNGSKGDMAGSINAAKQADSH